MLYSDHNVQHKVARLGERERERELTAAHGTHLKFGGHFLTFTSGLAIVTFFSGQGPQWVSLTINSGGRGGQLSNNFSTEILSSDKFTKICESEAISQYLNI